MTLTAWQREHYVAPGETVHLQVGIFPGNVWIGSSRAYGRVYRPHVLTADDIIVVCPGGLFVAVASGDGTNCNVHHARFLPDPNSLLSRGGRDPDRLPDSAQSIPATMTLGELGDQYESPVYPDHAISWPRFGWSDVLEQV